MASVCSFALFGYRVAGRLISTLEHQAWFIVNPLGIFCYLLQRLWGHHNILHDRFCCRYYWSRNGAANNQLWSLRHLVGLLAPCYCCQENALSGGCDIHNRPFGRCSGMFFRIPQGPADNARHIYCSFGNIAVFGYSWAVFVLAFSLVDAYKNSPIQPALSSHLVNQEAENLGHDVR